MPIETCDEFFGFRLTHRERETLQRLATECGVSKGAAIRQWLDERAEAFAENDWIAEEKEQRDESENHIGEV